MSLGDVSLACAQVVADHLVAYGGVHHACISPGSRSTPIALALDRHPEITTHVHLDERSSAFFALGLSRATRSPVVVACTSGTAAAELFPAVVEAFQSRVPLIVLTADRPPSLRGTGANQTIDQVELYGKFAVFAELPPPSEPVAVNLLRGVIDDALREAAFPQRPVHLNLPFDEPLTPDGAAVAMDEEEPPAQSKRDATPFASPIKEADALAAEISDRRGVVLLGRTIEGWIDEETFDVLMSLGWPVLAEPASNGRRPGHALSAGQALIGSADWLATHMPEVVLQIGTFPTTRASQGLVAGAEKLVVIDAHFPEPDPEGRAALRIRENPVLVFSELVGRRVGPAPEGWLEGWLAADRAARSALDTALDSTDEPVEQRIAQDLAAWMPDGATLFVGNSMPVRDLDYAMAPRDGLRVLANRGASGIDGLVSTALGVADSGDGPTAALIGDLSFVYDVGALLWNGRRRIDLTIVVVNNGGGAVFSFLPQHDLPEFERLFATPHELDLAAICAAAGVGYERVDTMSEFTPALERSLGGVNVVDVVVHPGHNRAYHAEVQAVVDAALRDLA